MSKMLTAAVLCMVALAAADDDPPRNSKDTEPTPLGETIVGESVPLYMEIYYSPANYCKVDATADPGVQLIQCKNQRKGWLKI